MRPDLSAGSARSVARRGRRRATSVDFACAAVTTRLLDTHCHVHAYDDPIAVLDDARRNGIDVVAVTEDPGRFRVLRTRLGRRPGVHLAIGLHPLRAADTTTADLARLLRMLPHADWIGEIGLDFSRVGAATRQQQLRVFDALLAEPSVLRHPLTVHSRGAERDTIRRLLQVEARAVLHWYTGPLAAAEEAISGGLWVSVNPSMVRSARGSSLLAMVPPLSCCSKAMDHSPGWAAVRRGLRTFPRCSATYPASGSSRRRASAPRSSTTRHGCLAS